GFGTVQLVKIGSGTLTLTGTSNTYSSGTTVSGGTLKLGDTNPTALGATTGSLTVNTGGTLDLNGNGNGTAVTVGALSGTGGTITSSVAGPGPLTLVVGDASNTSF